MEGTLDNMILTLDYTEMNLKGKMLYKAKISSLLAFNIQQLKRLLGKLNLQGLQKVLMSVRLMTQIPQ